VDAPRSTPSEPAVPTPIRPAATAGVGGATATVEQLADLWPRVRQDVKAVNRRIEALLSSVDPAFVVGSQITLATPYPFHRDKLNADDVRVVVEEAISRLLGGAVAVTTILRDDVERLRPIGDGAVAAPDRNVLAAPSPIPEPAPEPEWDLDPFANGEQRVQAAKNIFDADEIDPANSD
jgi:hypothetical protein